MNSEVRGKGAGLGGAAGAAGAAGAVVRTAPRQDTQGSTAGAVVSAQRCAPPILCFLPPPRPRVLVVLLLPASVFADFENRDVTDGGLELSLESARRRPILALNRGQSSNFCLLTGLL